MTRTSVVLAWTIAGGLLALPARAEDRAAEELRSIKEQAGWPVAGGDPVSADVAAAAARIAKQAAETRPETAPISTYMARRRLRALKDDMAAGRLSATATAEDKAGAERATPLLDEMADEAGTGEPLYAELVSGLVVSPNEGAAGDEAAQNVGAYVRWRSRYFGVAQLKESERHGLSSEELEKLDRERVFADRQNFRLSGRFGRVPVTALLAEPESEIEATDVPAFVWDARLEWAFHGETTDMVAYAGGGQTWLVKDSVTRTIDDTTAELALSGGRAAWMGEAGLAYNLYQEGRLNRMAGRDASPRFSVSLAYRRDALLASAKDFGKTNDRLVFRMLLAQLHVFDHRDGAKEPGPFSIRFGVEHERGLTSNGAPAATRLLIAGDINILKALGGSD
jgi:hypothetical protein